MVPELWRIGAGAMTRRQRILDAIVHRPFFIAPWFIFQNRRWSLLRWMRNPSQCRFEHEPEGLLLRDQLLGRLPLACAYCGAAGWKPGDAFQLPCCMARSKSPHDPNAVKCALKVQWWPKALLRPVDDSLDRLTQPCLWDTGLQAWESPHDPAEGL